jgi:hypothetical protein
MKKGESHPLIQTTLRLPEPLLERLKVTAVRRKTTLRAIAVEAFETWLKTNAIKGGKNL